MANYFVPKKGKEEAIVENLDFFTPGMIVLLENGEYALVSSVSPASKIAPTDKDRSVILKKGKRYDKSEYMSYSYGLVVKSTSKKIAIMFDMKDNITTTIADLRLKTCGTLGFLTEEKMKQYYTVNARYMEDM